MEVQEAGELEDTKQQNSTFLLVISRSDILGIRRRDWLTGHARSFDI